MNRELSNIELRKQQISSEVFCYMCGKTEHKKKEEEREIEKKWKGGGERRNVT